MRSSTLASVVRVLVEGIVRIGHDGVLGDVANPGDDHHPREQRDQPDEGIGPPAAGQREASPEQRVDRDLVSELFAEAAGTTGEWPGRIAERVEEL